MTNPDLADSLHVCPACGKEFEGHPRRVYCSDTCKKAAQNHRHYQRRKPKIIRRVLKNRKIKRR